MQIRITIPSILVMPPPMIKIMVLLMKRSFMRPSVSVSSYVSIGDFLLVFLLLLKWDDLRYNKRNKERQG